MPYKQGKKIAPFRDCLTIYDTLGLNFGHQEGLVKLFGLLLTGIIAIFDANVGLAQACAPNPAEVNLPMKLADQHDGARAEMFGLHSQLCNGKLYLVDLQTDRSQTQVWWWQVNENWWLEEAHSIRWLDGRRDRIEIVASFITGIGPTGTRPFTKQFVFASEADNWSLARTTDVPRPLDNKTLGVKPGTLPVKPFHGKSSKSTLPSRTLTNASEFADWSENANGALADLQIDWRTHRLVLANIWLTSGMARVKHTSLINASNQWVLSYRVKYPRIGTHDMKSVQLFALVPNDGRKVIVVQERRNRIEGKRIDSETGVVVGR